MKCNTARQWQSTLLKGDLVFNYTSPRPPNHLGEQALVLYLPECSRRGEHCWKSCRKQVPPFKRPGKESRKLLV